MDKKKTGYKTNSILVAVNELELISQIETEVKRLFEGEGTGHDWFHINRVRKNALKIGKAEGADLFVIELAALLHDIADHKFHNNDLKVGPERARQLIEQMGGSVDLALQIGEIVAQVSFKGASVETPVASLEAAVVQDADRLDAIGAIGVARAFAYGGSKKHEIYNPEKTPNLHSTFLSYAKDEGTTVNHFYEKLLLLKGRMQTETAKKMAEGRHDFMVKFLDMFYAEWKGMV